jgi:hypothetical protein
MLITMFIGSIFVAQVSEEYGSTEFYRRKYILRLLTTLVCTLLALSSFVLVGIKLDGGDVSADCGSCVVSGLQVQ